MDAREAVQVMLNQVDRCQEGRDLHRAYHAATEIDAIKSLNDYYLNATLLEFEAAELHAKLCKPGAPVVYGLLPTLDAIAKAYGEVATSATMKGMRTAAAAATAPGK